uniref:RBR-type E3 ubiquitin transferase n=1 Tax=Strongyloides stercoralis TaxID=6248 RepID=A0AAF5HXV3_STRER
KSFFSLIPTMSDEYLSSDNEYGDMSDSSESSTSYIEHDQQSTSNHYKLLENKHLVSEMDKILDEVRSVTNLPKTYCRILLHQYKWDKQTLIEKYYEQESDAFFKKYNLINPSSLNRSIISVATRGTCNICCSEEVLTESICGHKYCNQCWLHYFKTKITDHCDHIISCQEYGCDIAVDDDMVIKIIGQSAPLICRYKKLITKSFVESNKNLKYCPNPECYYITKIISIEDEPITCQCGFVYCFKCGHEWHEPLHCDIFKRWLRKCSDDSETSNWLNVHTKECPKCASTIEKNGGCNHMICHRCKYEYCWVCLQEWGPHGNNWYSCNKYNEKRDSNNHTNVTQARAKLNRYLHYYQRYANHQQSLRLEGNLNHSVEEAMQLFQNEGMSWIEVQFLKTAVSILSNCRKTLMYSYAFAYYLERGNQTDIFEGNQADLESSTESLSASLERLSEDTNMMREIKRKIQDKCRYVDRRRVVLLNHIKEGYEQKSWIFTSD